MNMMGDGNRRGARPVAWDVGERPVDGAPLHELRTRYCIFCGSSPKAKTVEHVIPQWLIELTGSPVRKAAIAVAKDGSLIERSFNSFKFPACERCNSLYSGLEGRVSQHFRCLARGDGISSQDAVDLLDWFDKVRVGLWLGGLLLNNPNAIAPKFFISQRVGYADRALSVWRTNRKGEALGWLGTETLLFRHMPISFVLVFNDLVFLNMSTLGLCGSALGVPFISSAKSAGVYDPRMMVLAQSGTGQPSYPVLSNWTVGAHGLELYQSIVRDDTTLVDGALPEAYPPEYLAENRSGMLMSSVFMRDARGALVPINAETRGVVPPVVSESSDVSAWCASYAADSQHRHFVSQAAASGENPDQDAHLVKTLQVLKMERQEIVEGRS